MMYDGALTSARYAGIRQVLQQFAVIENLDLAEAIEFVERPHEGQPAIPFGRMEPPAAATKRKPSEEPGPSKGKIQPRHHSSELKYGGRNKFWESMGKSDISQSLPAHLRTVAWVKALEDLEEAAVSRATGAKYRSALSNLSQFGAESNTKISWPIRPKLINAFVIWCHEKKNLSAGSIKTYLTGTRHAQRAMGFKPLKPSATEKFLIQGVRNSSKLKKGKRGADPKPMTYSLLKRFKKFVQQEKRGTGVGHAVWAAATVAFFSSCRLGDLLTEHKDKFDRFSDLLWEDLKILRDGTWKLHLKNSKVFSPGGRMHMYSNFEKRKCVQ